MFYRNTAAAVLAILICGLWPIASWCTAGELCWIRLVDGSFGRGRIVSVESNGYLSWQNEGFKTPFELPWSSVLSITASENLSEEDYDDNHETSSSENDPRSKSIRDFWLIELYGGMQVCGSIKSLDQRTLVVQSPLLGDLVLQRQWVRRISRDSEPEKPLKQQWKQLNEIRWKPQDDPEAWQQSAEGHLSSLSKGTIHAALDLPSQFVCRLQLRVGSQNDFVIAFRADRNQPARRRPQNNRPDARHALNNSSPANGFATFEAWSGKLFFICQLNSGTDMTSLGSISSPEGLLDITVWIDQVNEQAAVRLLGNPVQHLKFNGKLREMNLGQMLVECSGGGLTLNRLQLSHWDGRLPDSWLPAKSQVELKDEPELAGRIWNLDTENRQWVIQTFSDPVRIDFDRLLSGYLAANSDGNRRRGTGTAASSESASRLPKSETISDSGLRIALTDGSRLHGRFVSSVQRQLAFRATGVENDLQIPSSSIVEIVPVPTNEPPGTTPGDEVPFSNSEGSMGQGVLVSPTSSLRGTLSTAPADDRDDVTLYWQPLHSRLASSVLPSHCGEIALGLAQAVDHLPARSHSPDGSQQKIVFHSGDQVLVKIDRMDHQGAHFRSENSAIQFAPYSQIHRVILQPQSGVDSVSGEKMDRLLSIPRSQQTDPPTHLLIGRSGDVLRGKLTGVSQQIASFEARGTVSHFPIDRLAEIVWLQHDQSLPDQLLLEGGSQQPPSDAQSDDSQAGKDFRIRALLLDGQRMMFTAVRRADDRLIGQSSIWGEVSVPLEDLERLEFGIHSSD